MCSSFLCIGFGGTIVGFLLWFFGNGWNRAAGGDDDFQTGLDPKDNLLTAATALTWTLRIFPSFCLGNGLFYAINLGDGDNFIKGGNVTSVWDQDVLLFEVIFLGAQSILYLLLAIQIDKLSHNAKVMSIWRKTVQILTCRSLFSTEAYIKYATADDEDVVSEEERVKSGRTSTDLIAMNDLTKIYDNGKVAVDNLSLGIPAGECFGLLGINGTHIVAGLPFLEYSSRLFRLLICDCYWLPDPQRRGKDNDYEHAYNRVSLDKRRCHPCRL